MKSNCGRQCIEPLAGELSDVCGRWESIPPDEATGPAAWLRYQLETQHGADVPVIYLPGIGRSAFRSADQCPDRSKHLFALQFQGQFWTQKNGKRLDAFCISIEC